MTSTFGKVSEFSSTSQPPSGPVRTNTSGTIGCTTAEPNARPGLGLSRRISAIMSVRSSSSTPQSGAAPAKSRRATSSRCADQRLHRGIEAVALLELDRQAFAQIARAHAGRIEGLQDREHRFDLGQRRAELLGDRCKIAGEIAGLIDQIDQVLRRSCGGPDRRSPAQAARPDDRRASSRPTRRLRDCSRRPRGRRSRRRPIPNRRRARSAAGRGGASADRRERRSRCRCRSCPRSPADPFHVLAHPVGRSAVGPRRSLPARPRGALARLIGLAGLSLGALQQRIALELAFHIGRQVEIGELQQLDGLHQLRRHHERLALPEFESLRKRHVAVQYWSGSCLSDSIGRCTPRCGRAIN